MRLPQEWPFASVFQTEPPSSQEPELGKGVGGNGPGGDGGEPLAQAPQMLGYSLAT
jgi:hypothetical protein